MLPPALCCSSPADFFRDLAPVTRLLLVTYLITGLGAALKVVPLAHMYHTWGLEFTLKTFPQVRRWAAEGKCLEHRGLAYVLAGLLGCWAAGCWLLTASRILPPLLLQLWRLVTNFMFIGGPSFGFLFKLLWL